MFNFKQYHYPLSHLKVYRKTAKSLLVLHQILLQNHNYFSIFIDLSIHIPINYIH